MVNHLSRIQLEKIFDLFLRKGQVFFRLGQLPMDIHYTLVYNEKYDDINLHLTRNVSDQNNKPHIKIFKIKRQLFLNNIEAFVENLIYTCLKPIDMAEFGKDNDYEVGFISFDDLNNSDLEKSFRKDAAIAIAPYLKKKGNRELKILDGFQEDLFKIAIGKDFQDKIYDLMQPVADSYDTIIEGGVIVTNTSANTVVRIKGQWYFLRTDMTPFQMLRSIVNRRTAYHLICKWEDAVERIVTANSFSDTELYNNPCQLEIDPMFVPRKN